MRSERRPLLFLAVALLVLAGATFGVMRAQRTTALRAADLRQDGAATLTGMLDQETAVRGFAINGREVFLAPYEKGRAGYAAAHRRLARLAREDGETRRLLAEADGAAATWRALAAALIAQVRRDGPLTRPHVASALHRKAVMDRFRSANSALLAHLDARRDADLRSASLLALLVVLVIVVVSGAVGWWLIRRAERARETLLHSDARYRDRQREFTDVIQVVSSEGEAHETLKRHLERSIPDSATTILKRNNSENLLQATTPLRDGGPLDRALRQAEPRDCIAVRMARRHDNTAEGDALLSCAICGATGRAATCSPLLVGGQVIGSVLVEHDRPLDAGDERLLGDTVAQAAPVLANLKAIAIAEARAATDALTGLPNRRAMTDHLRRMTAHASRTVQPLAAIAIDLDHFKRLNDEHGHETGDTVLASFGEVLRSCVRESDVAGRMGGEEFLVLAPDTDADGAAVLAEKLRAVLERQEFPNVERRVTASFGLAVLPRDAHTAELLVRRADRALYAAKQAGRNRVEAVAPVTADA